MDNLHPTFQRIFDDWRARGLANAGLSRDPPEPDDSAAIEREQRDAEIERRVDESMRDAEVISDSLQDNPRLPDHICRLIQEAHNKRPEARSPFEAAVVELVRKRLEEFHKAELEAA